MQSAHAPTCKHPLSSKAYIQAMTAAVCTMRKTCVKPRKPIKLMKRLAVLAAPTRASCSHRLTQSGPQPRRRTMPLILPGAQNTSSPVLIGHCVTLLSDPAHAKAKTWGGTFPHTLPSLHPENPAEAAKPIALQATAAEPLVNPSRQTGAQALCVSQIHFQSSDLVWQNWRATGPDQAEFSIEESASSACAAKHDRVTSVA